MDKVKLFTRDGGFVAEVPLPPFQVPAEVILWGERFFVLGGYDASRPGAYVAPADGQLFYYEVMCWVCPPDQTWGDRNA